MSRTKRDQLLEAINRARNPSPLDKLMMTCTTALITYIVEELLLPDKPQLLLPPAPDEDVN